MLHGMFARQFDSPATWRLQRRLPFLCIARMGVSDHHLVYKYPCVAIEHVSNAGGQRETDGTMRPWADSRYCHMRHFPDGL